MSPCVMFVHVIFQADVSPIKSHVTVDTAADSSNADVFSSGTLLEVTFEMVNLTQVCNSSVSHSRPPDTTRSNARKVLSPNAQQTQPIKQTRYQTRAVGLSFSFFCGVFCVQIWYVFVISVSLFCANQCRAPIAASISRNAGRGDKQPPHQSAAPLAANKTIYHTVG